MTDDRYATVRYNQARRRVLGRRWWVSQDPETAAEQIAEYLGGLRRGEAWAAEAARRARAQGGMTGPVELVLDRLTEAGCLPRRSGPSWSAKCPAHDDKSPSLSVSEGSDGRALVNCHAGCSLDSVLEVLKLAPGDLFPPKAKRGRPEPEATYDYVDEQGALVFQVLRMEGHKFLQRRPNGKGGWIWKLGNTRRVPYRLPEVLAAVAAKQTVFVAEGEKDVLALVRAGVVATCNSEGAGKWRAGTRRPFTGPSWWSSSPTRTPSGGTTPSR